MKTGDILVNEIKLEMAVNKRDRLFRTFIVLLALGVKR